MPHLDTREADACVLIETPCPNPNTQALPTSKNAKLLAKMQDDFDQG